MPERHSHPATGFQIAFFVLALLLLAAPADKYLFSQWAWVREHELPVSRFAIFAVVAATLFGIPALRRICINLISTPIPKEKRLEVGVVFAMHLIAGFAAMGAAVSWIWIAGGEPALARRVGEEMKDAEQLSHALALGGILTFIVLGGLIAPIIEELVFRGMLYPAWALQWGWFPSALATSLLFAILHPNRFSQFFASLLYICLFRRTGSLRAPIIVHALFNVLMWYPLVGQFIFPSAARGTGEISYWAVNISCLAIVTVALPLYLWMSRDANAMLPSPERGLAVQR